MNYVKQIRKITGIVAARYRGVSLKKENGYWMCLGERCVNFEECDTVIDAAAKSLSESIMRKK